MARQNHWLPQFIPDGDFIVTARGIELDGRTKLVYGETFPQEKARPGLTRMLYEQHKIGYRDPQAERNRFTAKRRPRRIAPDFIPIDPAKRDFKDPAAPAEPAATPRKRRTAKPTEAPKPPEREVYFAKHRGGGKYAVIRKSTGEPVYDDLFVKEEADAKAEALNGQP